MWIVIAACRVGGRLLSPGEPLPDLSEDRIARLRDAGCVEWRGEEAPEVARELEGSLESEIAPPPGDDPPAEEEPKPRRRSRSRRRLS